MSFLTCVKMALNLKVPIDLDFLISKEWILSWKNGAQSGRSGEFDEERLIGLLHELAEQIDCDRETGVNHFHSTVKVQKLVSWATCMESSQRNSAYNNFIQFSCSASLNTSHKEFPSSDGH